MQATATSIGLDPDQSLGEAEDLYGKGQHVSHHCRFSRIGIASKLVDQFLSSSLVVAMADPTAERLNLFRRQVVG
ncbi:MAG TPA: hypothetical protein VNV87_02110 [Acidimicrobiales bacterium]|jgi:hypothetical protein|nr:hypothetical protein [Acidimicrobiales bacterium]